MLIPCEEVSILSSFILELVITTFYDIAFAYNMKGSQIGIAVLDFSNPKPLTQFPMLVFSVNSSTTALTTRFGYQVMNF